MPLRWGIFLALPLANPLQTSCFHPKALLPNEQVGIQYWAGPPARNLEMVAFLLTQIGVGEFVRKGEYKILNTVSFKVH